MDEALLPPSAFSEAADMDTPANRLKELARFPILLPLIAANPATPATILTQLSEASEVEIRRAVALNPNTPLQVLGRLAGEFPGEFLRNPVLPILNMTQPGFLKDLPFLAWAGLLRFEQLSPAWFQQLRTDIRYQRTQPLTWKLLQLHVNLTGPARKPLMPSPTERGPRTWKALVQDELRRDLQATARLSSPGAAEERELFWLLVLLLPPVVPMLKTQWIEAARTAERETGLLLASSVAIGGKTLTRLAQERSLLVRCQVARHPRTSAKLLGRLATSRHPEVRGAVASNPRTPAELIPTLLADSQASVRRAAVSHPSLTTRDHEMLARDDESSVRAALAALHLLDNTLLAQLASDPATTVRAAVARNLYASREILATLVRDDESAVRAAVAGNPCLPAEMHVALLNDSVETVRARLAGNACLPEQGAVRLAQDSSSLVRVSLAANPRAPVSLLDQLWHTGKTKIWRGLARNPRLSADLLAQLALQGDARVRIAVAAHKQTPPEVLRELAQENRREIWYALAANPHTPLDVLERALATSDIELWLRLFNHPAMQRSQHRPFFALLASKLQQLIARGDLPDWLRRVVFQYYTALPVALLEPFAGSPFWEERYLAARHPRAPEVLLNELAHDGICYVRTAAQDALAGRQRPGRVSPR